MTASISLHSIAPTAFCDHRFKTARVLGSALYNLVTALFFKIIATTCGIIGLKESHHTYRQRAFHHLTLAGHLFTYGLYGKNIINFATNLTGRTVSVKDTNTNEREELKKLYGPLFESMLQAANDKTVPIDEKKLARYPSDQGICLGASIDFLHRYIEMCKKGHAPLAAIKKISSLFTEGGTEEAQITQLLQTAQNHEEITKQKAENYERLQKELTVLIKATNEELEKKQNEAIKSVRSSEEARSAIEKISREVIGKLDEFREKVTLNTSLFNAQANFQRLLPLAKANHLDLKIEKILSDEGIQEKKAPKEFHSLIEQFSPGGYLLTLSCTKEAAAGHAIAYIKESQERGYIFDPNIATLIASTSHEQSDLLWNITKTFYNTKDDCSIVALKCAANT